MLLLFHGGKRAAVWASSVFMKLVLFLWGARCKGGLVSHGLFGVYLSRRAALRIGSRCMFLNATRANHVGVNRKCYFAAHNSASLTIGDSCGFSGTVICAACGVTIGDRVLLGANCTVTDSDHHPVDYLERRKAGGKIKTAPIIIEDDVWVGMNATILKGVRIGRGSVVAAGAVVTRDVPPLSIVAGVPARVIRTLAG